MVQAKSLGQGYTTICGGGRYSGLVEELGGPDTPGVGFGIGLERLMLLLNEEGLLKKADPDLDVYVVGIGETTNTASFKLVEAARDAGFVAERDYLNRKPKAQFKTAAKENAKVVLTIGQKELESGTVHFKVMATGEETTLPLDRVFADFKAVYQEQTKG